MNALRRFMWIGVARGLMFAAHLLDQIAARKPVSIPMSIDAPIDFCPGCNRAAVMHRVEVGALSYEVCGRCAGRLA